MADHRGGRIDLGEADNTFRPTCESIKPIDGCFIGMFPHLTDQVGENAERAHKIPVGT